MALSYIFLLIYMFSKLLRQDHDFIAPSLRDPQLQVSENITFFKIVTLNIAKLF